MLDVRGHVRRATSSFPVRPVVRKKQNVVVVNMDPVMHDIQAYETSQFGPRMLFNVPLPMNQLRPRDLKENERLLGSAHCV